MKKLVRRSGHVLVYLGRALHWAFAPTKIVRREAPENYGHALANCPELWDIRKEKLIR